MANHRVPALNPLPDQAGQGAPPPVSIVVATHHRPEMLSRLLESVRQLSYPKSHLELIVVGGERDSAGQVVQTFAETAGFRSTYLAVPSHADGSASFKRNVGARSARGEILAFTDDDCVVHQNWLAAGVAPFVDPGVGAVEGAVEIPMPIAPTLTYRGSRRLSLEGGYQTCNILYRKSVFDEAGGFDPAFPYYLEDTDLAYTVMERGYVIPFAATAFVSHPVQDPRPLKLLTMARNDQAHPILVPETRPVQGSAAQVNQVAQSVSLRLPGSLRARADTRRLEPACRCTDGCRRPRIPRSPASRARLPRPAFYRQRGGPHCRMPARRSRSTALLLGAGQCGSAFSAQEAQAVARDERIYPDLSNGNFLFHLFRYYWAMPFAVDRAVLDAGCGSGYGAELLAAVARAVVAVDHDADAIAQCRDKYAYRRNLSFEVQDVANLALASDSFDLTVSFEVYEHLESAQSDQFLHHLSRTCRRGGSVLLSTPNRLVETPFMKSAGKSYSYHVNSVSPGEFKARLKRHFRTVRLYGQRIMAPRVKGILRALDILNLRHRVLSYRAKRRWIVRFLLALSPAPRISGHPIGRSLIRQSSIVVAACNR